MRFAFVLRIQTRDRLKATSGTKLSFCDSGDKDKGVLRSPLLRDPSSSVQFKSSLIQSQCFCMRLMSHGDKAEVPRP